LHWDLDGVPIHSSPANENESGSGGRNSPEEPLIITPPSMNLTSAGQPLKYFLNDAQCYGRLMRELTRYVKTCMSPNNPNQHVS
jgi:hypothetical protein